MGLKFIHVSKRGPWYTLDISESIYTGAMNMSFTYIIDRFNKCRLQQLQGHANKNRRFIHVYVLKLHISHSLLGMLLNVVLLNWTIANVTRFFPILC